MFNHLSCMEVLQSEEMFNTLYTYLQLGNLCLIGKMLQFPHEKRNGNLFRCESYIFLKFDPSECILNPSRNLLSVILTVTRVDARTLESRVSHIL